MPMQHPRQRPQPQARRLKSGLVLWSAMALHIFSTATILAAEDVADQDQSPRMVSDVWSTYAMGGNLVGYLHETLHADEAGQSTATTELVIVINRLGNKVELKGHAEFTESPAHRLTRVVAKTSSSAQTTFVTAEIGDTEITVTTRSGDKDYSRAIPFTEPPLGPEAARRLCLEKLREPGDEVTYRLFAPELEGVLQVTRKVLARETLEAGDQQLPALKIEEQVEKLPGKRTVWLDQEARMLRQQEAGPFGQIEVQRSSRVAALAAALGQELPPEMYDQTLVRSNIRLPRPRSLSRLVLTLTQTDSSLGWPDFAGPGQRVLAREEGSLRLEVTTVEPVGTTPRPISATPELSEFLEPNAILQSDDAEVRRIALEVVGDERDVLRAARKLRAWVSDNMRLDLGIAVAPASEVARNRGGTCVAYSVLLASLLRAVEIPSRVTMGYVYVSGVWGGHAWVEFWAGDRWLPLDAAVSGEAPGDAARIACVRDSLQHGMGPLMGSLLQVYGNVRIDIREYEVDAKSTQVHADASPFTVRGDTYENPWLGLRIVKRPDSHFARMDAVWPDATILEIMGPEDRVIRLSQEGGFGGPVDQEACRARLLALAIDGQESQRTIAGREAVVIIGAGHAAAAFADGSDVWVLSVEAADVSQVFDEITTNLRLSR